MRSSSYRGVKFEDSNVYSATTVENRKRIASLDKNGHNVEENTRKLSKDYSFDQKSLTILKKNFI